MARVDAIDQGPRRSGRRARTGRVSSSLAEINVVPLIDVMLVLLVIFMVTAPIMTQGFPVQLPESRRSQPIDQAPVTVAVPASFPTDRQVRLGDEAVRIDLLPERIRQELSSRVDKNVVLASDGAITMQQMMSVFDQLRAGGVVNVGIQTQPTPVRRNR
jgi:biopolymer transport protein ExbD